MPPFLTRVVERAKSALSGISPGQRVVSLLLVAGLLLGGVFFTKWVSAPTYAPLFSNLASTDASAIVDELNAAGVAYELADGGGTVMVPKDQVYTQRLAMSGKGLPAGKTTGYALLDKEGVTTSDFQQQVKYQRAVEGELSDTLSAMDGVRTAVVHVAMPKKDVFADDTAKPTASVLVGLEPGTKLSATQITAMTHLVSSSIEGMTPEDVTLADTSGAVLSAAGDGGVVGAAGDAQNQMQADMQARLAKQAQEMLDRVVGPNKAIVRVSADLNFDARAATNKTYTYTKGVPPLSESSETEKMTGGGTQVGGVLGPNNPDGTNTTVGGNGTYDKTSGTKNNAVNESVETVKSAPGTIKRMTVSVLMDDKAGARINKAEVEALMQTAVGYDVKRGDAMTVAAMPFDTSAAEQAKKDLAEAEKAAQQEQMITYAKIAGICLLVLIALIIGFVKSRKRSPKNAPMSAEAEVELSRIREVIANKEREMATEDVLDAEAARRQQVRTEIADLIDNQPDEVTAMLRAWLAEERA
jgi:flagellar M-ring protein FliF